MPTGIECICCAKISQIADKTLTEKVGCIVLHPGFQGVCLDPWVLVSKLQLSMWFSWWT